MNALFGLLEPEEFVGRLWHRLSSGRAPARFPEAGSSLESVRGTLGVLFRGLGGPPGLAIAARASGARDDCAARRDARALYLPAIVDLWPERADNRALHVWLVAFLAHLPLRAPGEPSPARDVAFLHDVRRATRATLAAAPGLTAVHGRLRAALLATRPRRARPAAEAAVERAVRSLLGEADERAFDLACDEALAAPSRRYRRFDPVLLWGEALAVGYGLPPAPGDESPDLSGSSGDGAARKAQREAREEAERRDYLALNRFEKMLTLSESMNLARPVEDDDEEGGRRAAETSDTVVLSPHRKPAATKLKLELELSPSAAAEGAAPEGLRYPEWDWRRRAYREDYCLVLAAPVRASHREWTPSPDTLRRIGKVRRRFEAYRPHREQARAQIDGDDLDLDAVVRARADFLAGAESSDRIYLSARQEGRDLAVALLLDASLSTDAWVGARRVIDIARESALIFCHALDAGGDAHAVYAFSSKGRHEVRIDIVKDFGEPLAEAGPRLGALKPGFYTRIGAALRHTAAEIEKQPAREKLVIVLTDGKPNDVDHYEGRFGVEDTRRAIREARRRSVRAFGVAIDARAQTHFPMLFGRGGFAIVSDPARLPAAMPLLLRHLVGG
jgi:nitric oxide reductase NorD protein